MLLRRSFESPKPSEYNKTRTPFRLFGHIADGQIKGVPS